MGAPRVGVLGLQGDSFEHHEAFAAIGVHTTQVKLPADLDEIDALVLPGGESTALSKLLESSDIFEGVSKRLASHTLSIFGTCAGMILCAQTILDGRPDQRSFKCFHATVRRNGTGRQQQSCEATIQVAGKPFEAVFIRPPVVTQTDEDVEILATFGDAPVLCAQGRHLFATFHPELGSNPMVHQLFLERFHQ